MNEVNDGWDVRGDGITEETWNDVERYILRWMKITVQNEHYIATSGSGDLAHQQCLKITG